MKILIWAPHGFGEHYWGPGISAYRLYKCGNNSSSLQVSVAHGFPKQKKYSGLLQNCYLIHNLTNTSKLNQIIFLVKSYFWIRKNYRNFDVVHCLSTFMISLLPAYWFEKNGIPVACKPTGTLSPFINNSFLSKIFNTKFIKKRIGLTISRYIAISTEIKFILMRGGVVPEKIIFLPNGVAVDRFKPVDRFTKSKNRKINGINDILTLIFVGQICNRKQPRLIVESLDILINENYRQVQVILLGPMLEGDDELKYINSYVEKKGLMNNFYYFSFSNEPENFYNLADIFILPSIREGLSNALLEAMSSGLPCLVTPVSGSDDLVVDGFNGYIIRDKQELVKRLNYLIDNDKCRYELGNNSRKIITKGYSDIEIFKRHLELFHEIVLEKKQS